MIRTLGRSVAAVALLLATVAVATVATNSTAGAANTNVTANCSTAPAIQTINNSDTLTITVGAGCGAVILMASGGGTATWMPSFPLTQGSPIGGLQQGDTVVFTAPASGSGSAAIGFMANAQSMPPAITFTVNFPASAPRNDSLTDNGNGSMTIAYSALSGPEVIWVAMYASGTTCPGTPPQPATGRLYLLAPNAPANPIGASPITVTGDYPATTGLSPYVATTIPSGSYEACLYYSSGQGPASLKSSLAITLTASSPTTTTASGDPVAPAFTG